MRLACDGLVLEMARGIWRDAVGQATGTAAGLSCVTAEREREVREGELVVEHAQHTAQGTNPCQPLPRRERSPNRSCVSVSSICEPPHRERTSQTWIICWGHATPLLLSHPRFPPPSFAITPQPWKLQSWLTPSSSLGSCDYAFPPARSHSFSSLSLHSLQHLFLFCCCIKTASFLVNSPQIPTFI